MDANDQPIRKRLILCCDGTWMDSDDGFNKPTLIPYVPTGTLQVASNVTRVARALRRVGLDGTPQIIFYHSGVGTSSSLTDVLTGGLLGRGISENVREVYSFIAANYTPGSEIILVGFSRGAFTARSVAGMIDNIGILTRGGMDCFYPIFKDQENFRTPNYRDIFPDLPFPNKPRGPQAAREYKRRLEDEGLTRVYDPDGIKIYVQAVAVWDTVGSLGIPNIALLAKLGLPHSTKEYKFYDTNLSATIKHAFQALALDEHRRPFSPAVWERSSSKDCTPDLRQVWFPGSHGNCGGGYDDQEIANITLAWMMDQLASIGVAFQDEFIDHIFQKNAQYYETKPKVPFSISKLFSRRADKQWAITPVYDKHKPIRPWGLGEIYESETGVWLLAGKIARTPGLYKRADPDSGAETNVPMQNTNERIHSCVRLRMELEGLDLDDIGVYKADALLAKGNWRLRRVRAKFEDAIPFNATWGPGAPPPEGHPEDHRWIWEYCGPNDVAPRERIMVEENLGPYERKLLRLNKGNSSYKRYRKRRRHRSRKVEESESLIDDDDRDERNSRLNANEKIEVVYEADPVRDRERRHRRRESEDGSLLVDDRRGVGRERERRTSISGDWGERVEGYRSRERRGPGPGEKYGEVRYVNGDGRGTRY